MENFNKNYNNNLNGYNFPGSFNAMPNIPFNGSPKGIFSNHGFTNRNDLMHNNLQNILLNEEIREYSVMIDSKDRNYQVYPDPFNYEVRFNPLPTSREREYGKTITYEEPAPVINDNFVNVRYIKFEVALLPYYTHIRKYKERNEDGDIVDVWKVDKDRMLSENFYTVLSLGSDYRDVNYRSTNDVLADSFAVIYYDCNMSKSHFMGYSENGVKIFPQDQLAKINKLKISFMDPYGNPLTCPHLNKKIKSNMICTCEDPNGDEDNECFIHNLRHPLNPIFQNHIHLKIGVVEPRLSKKNFS